MTLPEEALVNSLILLNCVINKKSWAQTSKEARDED